MLPRKGKVIVDPSKGKVIMVPSKVKVIVVPSKVRIIVLFPRKGIGSGLRKTSSHNCRIMKMDRSSSLQRQEVPSLLSSYYACVTDLFSLL